MLELLGNIKFLKGFSLALLISLPVYLIYDNFIDDPKLKSGLVNKAELAAVQAEYQRLKIIVEATRLANEQADKKVEEVQSQNEVLNKKLKDKILEDKNDNPKVTEEDLKWLGLE